MSENNLLFVSLMPHLKDRMRHDYIYNLCVKEVVDKAHIENVGYVTADCVIEELPSVWKRWFHEAEKPLTYIQRLRRRYRDFSGIFRELPSNRTRIFFLETTFSRLDLLALCLSILRHGKPKDEFWILFRLLFPKKFDLYRVFTRILHYKLRTRLTVLTDSETIRESLATEPYSAAVWSIPHTRHVPPFKRPEQNKILAWWPGPPRENKGLEEIRRLTSTGEEKARHFCLSAAASSGLEQRSEFLTLHLLKNELSNEEYEQKLAECQLVLLPYDPQLYKGNTSGNFVEAIVAHKMPLVKGGSWLASELMRFDLEALIVDWSREDFFAHCLSLLEDENIKKKLAKMQTSYAEFHCMSTFRDGIRKLLHRNFSSNLTEPLSSHVKV